METTITVGTAVGFAVGFVISALLLKLRKNSELAETKSELNNTKGNLSRSQILYAGLEAKNKALQREIGQAKHSLKEAQESFDSAKDAYLEKQARTDENLLAAREKIEKLQNKTANDYINEAKIRIEIQVRDVLQKYRGSEYWPITEEDLLHPAYIQGQRAANVAAARDMKCICEALGSRILSEEGE